MSKVRQSAAEIVRTPTAEAPIRRGSGAAEARAKDLADLIFGTIQRQTSGSIHDLEVEVRRDGVWLRGWCETYYCKQLAQHAAMGVADGEPLTNEIQVA